MKNSRHMGKGAVLLTAAGILTVIGIIIYQMVERTFMPVTVLLAVSIIITALGLGAAVKKPAEPANLTAVLSAALNAFALVYGFYLMIDPITWVATALEPFSVLYTFIAFEIIMATALILDIAAAFVGVVAEAGHE